MCEERKGPPGGNRVGAGRETTKAGRPSASHPITSRAESQDGTFEVRDLRGDHYYRIPDVFITQGYAAHLGPFGVAVYDCLVLHGNRRGSAWPSYGKIAALMGMSRRQVMRKIGDLAALRLIGLERRTRPNGEPDTNLIYLLDTAEWLPVGGVDYQSPGSDYQSPPLVTTSHHPSDSQSPEPDLPELNLPEPDLTSSSCVTRQPEPPAAQNDDDGSDLGTLEIDLAPDPETTNEEPAEASPVATVTANSETRVSGPAAEAAALVLREVAPLFDGADTFIRTHDPQLVGWIATGLLLDTGKRQRLSNPAGWLRRQVEQRATPNGASKERWRAIVAAIEAGEEPTLHDDDRDGYEALRRRYAPAHLEDLIEFE